VTPREPHELASRFGTVSASQLSRSSLHFVDDLRLVGRQLLVGLLLALMEAIFAQGQDGVQTLLCVCAAISRKRISSAA
jgi:hypothetical protein